MLIQSRPQLDLGLHSQDTHNARSTVAPWYLTEATIGSDHIFVYDLCSHAENP